MGLPPECQPDTGAVLARILDFIGESDYEVPTEASGLSPPLIDAMDRIGAADHLALQVNRSLALVTVMVDDDMHRPVMLWGDAQHGGMTGSRHLHLQTLVGQAHGIIVGMGCLLVVAETGSTLRRLGAEPSGEGCHRKRAVVLSTATHNPVTVAEPLQQRVRIVIRCHALLLRVAGLRCPEVLPVGREDSGQRLPVLLRALAEESGRPGRGRSRAHHRVQRTELAQVLQVVYASGHVVLQVVPEIEALYAVADAQVKRFLIVQQLNDDLPRLIAIEDHLQIGRHRQDLVHAPALRIDAHQREQTVEIGVVAETEVGPHPTSGDGGIGPGLYVLPQ